MTKHFATSPFGGRMMNAAHFLNYETLRKLKQDAQQIQNTDAHTQSDHSPIDRWKLLRALTEAREAYQLSSRTIAVLEALLSFSPDKQLDPTAALIVFPSNHELSLRLRGMSAPTIRRHIAILVELGFILRRDSPNGKRFVRRDSNGEIAMAFGFDLSPLVFKAAEIETHAHEAREFLRQRQQLRFSITIHLRDISKTIAAAFTEQCPGDWNTLSDQLEALSGRVERNGTLEALALREKNLLILREKVENLYISKLSTAEVSANESENEHHIQNSNIESLDKTTLQNPTQGSFVQENSLAPLNNSTSYHPELDDILKICPQISNYAFHTIKDWAQLRETANHVRSMLGITASAWKQACQTMGYTQAAITIAAILERAEHIRSAGGYLRKLTEKAAIGQYSVQPMLNALGNTRYHMQ